MLGGDLRFHVNRKVPFTEEAVIFFAAELTSAITYLHARGVVHRDIKPDNILLNPKGHAHLTDFNCATVFEHSKPMYSKTGTPSYMAPEVYNDFGYDNSVDWWSLGIVLFEVYHGKRPFCGTTIEELAVQITGDSYNHTKKITSKLSSLIDNLLSKLPEKRIGFGKNGHVNVANHEIFKGIDWHLLSLKAINPPFVPGQHSIEEYDSEDELDVKKIPQHLHPELDFLESGFHPYDFNLVPRPEDNIVEVEPVLKKAKKVKKTPSIVSQATKSASSLKPLSPRREKKPCKNRIIQFFRKEKKQDKKSRTWVPVPPSLDHAARIAAGLRHDLHYQDPRVIQNLPQLKAEVLQKLYSFQIS